MARPRPKRTKTNKTVLKNPQDERTSGMRSSATTLVRTQNSALHSARHPSVAPRFSYGLYRRTLVVPEVEHGRRYYLKFDAASKAAEVRLNGQPVGNHAGGYTAFTLDITDHIQRENQLEVTVDNGRKDITPISADFTFWGGIYRDVWLVSVPDCHFNMANAMLSATPRAASRWSCAQWRAGLSCPA